MKNAKTGDQTQTDEKATDCWVVEAVSDDIHGYPIRLPHMSLP